MSIASSVKEVFGAFGRARAAQDTYLQLSNMSDGALASRGITRQDIARIAFKDILDY